MCWQQIEEAMRYKLGRFMDSDDEEFELDRNDFLDIIRELKKQIFQVFQEAGMHFLSTFSFFSSGESLAHLSGFGHPFCVDIILRGGFRPTQRQLLPHRCIGDFEGWSETF